MRFSSRLAVAAIAAGLFSLAAPVATAQDNPNAFRFFGSYMWPSDELDLEIDTDDPNAVQVTETNEFDATWGVGVSYERRFSGPLGLEIGARYYAPDLVLPGNGVFNIPGSRFEDEVSIVPISLGLNFHLGSSERFDFYFGPQLVYVTYGSVDAPAIVPLDVEFDDELTWGAKVGLDIPLGDTWALAISAEYFSASGTLQVGDSEFDLDPKPLSVSVGAAVRF